MSEPEARRGLFTSLRQLVATAVEIAHVRLALLSNEIEQEKLRLFDAVVWGAFALMLLGVGALSLSALIVVYFWEDHRLAALAALAVIYLGGGAWLLYKARQRLRAPGGLFGTSVAELERDRAGLNEAE